MTRKAEVLALMAAALLNFATIGISASRNSGWGILAAGALNWVLFAKILGITGEHFS